MSAVEPDTLPAFKPPPSVESDFINSYNADSTIHDTIFTAWLAFIGYTVLVLIGARYGSGKYQWDVPLTDPLTWLKFALATALDDAKVRILNSARKTYWAIHFVIWVNLLFYLAVMPVQSIEISTSGENLEPADAKSLR
ncbi:MAG: hypothetical protein L6R38_004487 [Xanthoria sp. 2 TBL-2021]|nr:MAG: hypothetical protein L6R38_004487 [Xanthoria sp. 2 TBL-2021]